jgi:hypothetical protein
MLGADTLVFADPQRYGIEVVRSETGGWDYKHTDGHERYDRTSLDEAFRARSDLPLLCHGAYLLYATHKVEDLERITGLGRFGPISREMIEDDGVVLTPSDGVVQRCFGFDAFQPRDQAMAGAVEGNGSGASVPRADIDVAYLLKNGAAYSMDDDDKALCALVDGKRSIGEVLSASDLEQGHARARLARLVDRGIVLAPRESSAAPAASVAPAGAPHAA